jgi:GT2 family glycosyltransferase
MIAMPSPSSSVIVGIATHNRAKDLRNAIASALNQSHRPLRVAVVDDASTDETPFLRQEFSGVSWERWERARGYVRARNHMMLSSRDEYYVSLDDDSRFLEGDEVSIAVGFLERHPSVAAIAYDVISPDRPQSAPRGPEAAVALFIGCGHVLRLSVVRELGGYSEFPGTYGVEEKDFCLRLIDAGYEIVKLEGVHVWHDKAASARNLERQHRSGVCNDLTLAILRAPLGLLLPTLAWKIYAHLAFAIRRGLLPACLQGLRDFAFAAASSWRNRRPVRHSSVARFRALSKTPRNLSR